MGIDMRDLRIVVLAAMLVAVAPGGCTTRHGAERVSSCATSVLPRYRACIERVAADRKRCEENFRFSATHWCRKKVSGVELTEAQVAEHAAGCKVKGYAIDSAECRRDAARMLHEIQSTSCVASLWRGTEEWDQPPTELAACKNGVKCCEEPSKKANLDCDAAAANAIRLCTDQPAK